MAERARRRRAISRVVTIVLVVVGLGVGAVFGALELNERYYFDGLRPVPRSDRMHVADPATIASAERGQPNVSDGAVVDTQPSDTTLSLVLSDSSAAGDSADIAAAPADSLEAPADSSAAVPPPVSIAPTSVAPVIAEGRTELGDSVYAVREGREVTVHFDTYLTRTRRLDKFDRIVRETLPRIYGAPADSLLATVPVGQIAQGGDLLGELPRSGISFELADGSTLALWPRTREGRDGPLVVAYRATILR